MRLHLCLPLLLAAATLNSPAQTSPTQTAPSFVTDAQIPIPSTDGFLSPHGLAVAPGDTVFVADTGNHRLLQITAAGVQTTVSLGQFGPALQAPTGLALDAAGNLYVTDPPTNRLIKIPANGGHAITILAAPVLNQPTAVASDAAGNLAIVNAGNATVTVRRAAGPPVVFSTDATVLTDPVALAFDLQGALYIADAGSATTSPAVYRFPALGGTGTPLTPAGYPLQGITGLAVDPARNLYLLTAPDKQLLEVPASGATPFLIPQTGAQSPSGLALDNLGNLYIADTTTVTKLAYGNAADFGSLPVGSPSATYTFNFAFYTPTAVTASQALGSGSTGQEYLRQTGGTCAARSYYPTTNALGTVLPATCILRFNFRPTQVGGRPNAVQVVTSSGTASQLVTGVGLGAQLALLNAAVSLKFTNITFTAFVINAAETELYYSDGQATYRVPLNGGTPIQLAPISGHLALNGAGDLFILSGKSVTKVPGDGSPSTVLNIPGLFSPQSITIDSNGALYISDLGPGDPNSIFFSPAGFVLRVSPTGVTSRVLANDFPDPTLLAADGEGNIVVADAGIRQFLKIQVASGSFAFTQVGPTIGGLQGSNPANLAVDASGTLYFDDPGDFAQGFVYAPANLEGQASGVPGEYYLPLYTVAGVPDNFVSPINPFVVAPGNQEVAAAPSGKLYVANGAGPGLYLVNRTLGSIPPQAFVPGFQNFGGNTQIAYVFNVGNQAATFSSASDTFTESGNGIGSFTFDNFVPAFACEPGTVVQPSNFCTFSVTNVNAVGAGPIVTDLLHAQTNAVNTNSVAFRITGYGPPPTP